MTANTLVIDKLAFVQNLEQRGFSRPQAEGIADAINDIALAQLVTKSDLRDALAQQKMELIKFIFTGMATQTALLVALFELLR